RARSSPPRSGRRAVRPCPGTGRGPRRGARRPRACQWRPPRAPWPARRRRSLATLRPRRSGYPASPAPRARADFGFRTSGLALEDEAGERLERRRGRAEPGQDLLGLGDQVAGPGARGIDAVDARVGGLLLRVVLARRLAELLGGAGDV